MKRLDESPHAMERYQARAAALGVTLAEYLGELVGSGYSPGVSKISFSDSRRRKLDTVGNKSLSN